MDEQSTKPLTTWNQDGSFLPEDYVKSKGERRANLLSLSLFGVMMLAVVAAFFATNKKWMNVRDEKRSINAMYVQEAAKIDELKALEAQRDELIKKAEVTAALVERVPRSLLFAEIVRRMPDEVKLLEMELESEEIKKASSSAKKSAGVRTLSGAAKAAGGAKAAEEEESLVPEYRQSLTLVGVGRDNDNIADYIESLKNCSILTGVELQYIKETKIENADLRKFELRARIRNGIDARGLVNPDRPLDLPETLDPNDLIPAEPIILPPSQLGARRRADPGRPEERQAGRRPWLRDERAQEPGRQGSADGHARGRLAGDPLGGDPLDERGPERRPAGRRRRDRGPAGNRGERDRGPKPRPPSRPRPPPRPRSEAETERPNRRATPSLILKTTKGRADPCDSASESSCC
jgi:Tfp pilus assembly protein PilN